MRPCRPADNPFSSHRIDSLEYRLPEGSWPELTGRLHALGGRAALVGPEGSGKTTLLEELGRRLPGTIVLVRLGGSRRRPLATALAALPRSITGDHRVLVDSGERLGAMAWVRFRRAVRHAGGVVITDHAPGRLPTLIRCRTSPELLAELVAELASAEAGRLGPRLGELFTRHDGNIRLCLRELYDIYAGRR